MWSNAYRDACSKCDVSPRSDASILCEGRLIVSGNAFKNFENRLRDDEINAICLAAQSNSDLITMEFPYNTLTSSSARRIALGFQRNVFNCITELDLSWNSIDRGGAESLGHALCDNNSLLRLTLTGNPLGGGSGVALGNMLKMNSTLVKVDLAHCDLNMNDLVYIFGALTDNKTIMSLDASRPLLIDPDDVTSVVHHLALALRYNTTLCDLGLNFFNLVDSHLVQLIPAFCAAGITRLSLKGNRFSQDGGEILARLLERKQDFVALDVSNNRIRDVGASAIAKSICTHPRLQALYLEYNTIGETGLTALASAVESSRSLVALSLWGNDFSGASINAFYQIKHRLDVLQSVDFGLYLVDNQPSMYHVITNEK